MLTSPDLIAFGAPPRQEDGHGHEDSRGKCGAPSAPGEGLEVAREDQCATLGRGVGHQGDANLYKKCMARTNRAFE